MEEPPPPEFSAIDPQEARLRSELKLIKERWLKNREEDLNYVQEAFNNQYNLITLSGLGVLTGVGFALGGPVGFLFGSLALAWEVCWLGMAPFSERFRRSVRAERNATALAARELRRQDLLAKLPAELQAQQESARQLAQEIHRHAESAEEGELELLEETLAKLDYMLDQHARMLVALHALRQFQNESEAQGLARRVSALERELERLEPGKLRGAKEKNLEVLRQRLERAEKSREEREYLEVSLDTLENTLKLVRDRVIAATNAQGIASSLDEVVLEMGRHRDYMDEVEAQMVATERLAPELSEPPPAGREDDTPERRRERAG